MYKYITFLFYAILNFIAVPCAFSQAAADGYTINLSGKVINLPKCIVNGGADFNISLKTISSNKIGNGVYGIISPNQKYGTLFSIPIYCSGLKANGFKMYLTGDTSNINYAPGFNNFIFGSNIADVSLLIQKKNSDGIYSNYIKNSVINIPFVSGVSSVDFKSFLIKSINTLPSGNFTVTLSAVFIYE